MTKSRAALSEQDLLASNPADYMNAEQLAFFRQRLLSVRDELDRNASRTAADMKETVAQSDPADRATLEEEYGLELHTRERELRLMAKIQHALHRIEERTYGFCEETGEVIGLRRLLARPTAALTIEAQERREKSRRPFRD